MTKLFLDFIFNSILMKDIKIVDFSCESKKNNNEIKS